MFHKISGIEKKLWIRGGYKNFPRKIFCLTVPKNFVGESFYVSQNFWYRVSLIPGIEKC